MIVFDLRCSRAHIFEAWFGSSAAFADQQARGLLACPICGDGAIVKAVMAPNVGAKSNSRQVAPVKPLSDMPPTASAMFDAKVLPSAPALKAALHSLAKAQAQALEKSQWVGRAFADRARAMHVGEVEATPIHGETTLAEAKALVKEGVQIAALPLPVVPPDALN